MIIIIITLLSFRPYYNNDTISEGSMLFEWPELDVQQPSGLTAALTLGLLDISSGHSNSIEPSEIVSLLLYGLRTEIHVIPPSW